MLSGQQWWQAFYSKSTRRRGNAHSAANSLARLKKFFIIQRREFQLIGLWLGLGLILRLLNLGEKPPSTIEIATLGFGIGHGFREVPLNQVIDLATVLNPLTVDPSLTADDTMAHLMTESTHPPLYFVLTHFWLKLFPAADGFVSLWAGRSLSVLFGLLSIPAMFGFGWLAFESVLAAHFAALLMAISPFGIYLAQEARHYTLAVLWIIGSLSCFSFTLRCLQTRTPIAKRLALIWIAVNALGMATHYFFGLVLLAEGSVLAIVWLLDVGLAKAPRPKRLDWRRLYGVAIGSAIGAIVWLPAMWSVSDNELTQWIQDKVSVNHLLEPIARLAAWMVSMVMILPVEEQPIGTIVMMAVILVLALVGMVPILLQGWRAQMVQPVQRRMLVALMGVVAAAIVLILAVVYGRGTDLTVAPRYHFAYFPAVLVLVAVAFAQVWSHRPSVFSLPSRTLITFVLLIALLGGLTVGTDFSFKKSKRPDRLVAQIQDVSKAPVLIASEIKTLAEVRATVAIGYEWQQLANPPKLESGKEQRRAQVSPTAPKFLLLNEKTAPAFTKPVLLKAIDRQARPFDLWTIGTVSTQAELAARNCVRVKLADLKTGYADRHYRCDRLGRGRPTAKME